MASVFIASNTITTLFLCGGMSEGVRCRACSKLRRLGYSSVSIQMRRWTLVFTCFRKIAKSDHLLLPVSLSIRVQRLGSHWTDFSWNLIFKLFFENLSKILMFDWNLTNKEYSTWRPMYIYDNISLDSRYNEKCFRYKLQRKSKHTFLFDFCLSVHHQLGKVI